MKNIYKRISILIIALLVLSPLLVNAQFATTNTMLANLKDIIERLLIPLVFTLALLLFFWGVAKYIWSVGTEKEQGKKIMVWGIIALFIMSSIWGIVSFIRGELIPGYDDDVMPVPKIGQ